jgi:hypothetical protein
MPIKKTCDANANLESETINRIAIDFYKYCNVMVGPEVEHRDVGP